MLLPNPSATIESLQPPRGLSRLRGSRAGALAPKLALLIGLGLLVGCSSTGTTEDPSAEAAEPPKRIEKSLGPGTFVGAMTGTFSSKDRNLIFNVPLASWYVREEDRKGMGILGGAIAYDMVKVERKEGRPVAKKYTSFGLLGLAGHTQKRSIDGSGSFEKKHWVFPFYRYREENGRRVVYPLFCIPIHLKDKPRPALTYEAAPWQTDPGDPIDPPDVVGTGPVPRSAPPLLPPPDPALYPDYGLDKSSAPPRDEPALRRRTGVHDWDSDSPRTETVQGSWESARAPTAAAASPAAPRVHAVRRGETLYALAKRYYGNGKEWKRIYDANRDVMSSPDRVREGMRLRIP